MKCSNLPGEPLDRAVFEVLPSADDQGRIADHLGTFLIALHAALTEDFDPPHTLLQLPSQ